MLSESNGLVAIMFLPLTEELSKNADAVTLLLNEADVPPKAPVNVPPVNGR
jgi:hypothetical protein